ncbi:MAG TPA: hypothetical protein VFU06_03110 [Longimicrobiales bacterium]|nr:hypothetical protein [Longimicrobiales bacterium]
MLLLPLSCAAVLLAFAPLAVGTPGLFWAFAGAGGLLLAWTAAVWLRSRRSSRSLALEVVIRTPHWVQACAQAAVLLYWGWHVRFVYAFLPLIVAQLVFAYGVDALLNLSRRHRYPIGFGPFPVILSINLFLWFKPEWFALQFAMILVGFAAKEFIRWQREGRSAHIFNPSSFPLGLASILLIATASSDITLGTAIATTQFYPPHMYLVIFLVSLPGQVLFGVARMTLSAVVTLFLISEVYLQVTGTYLFFDSHIPLPVFLGMHLLFTDPSTSPRTGTGRVAFGAIYGTGTAAFYVLLSALGVPTFYDKLLPVPLMNLTVRGIDRLTRAPRQAVAAAPSSARRAHLAWTAVWACVFLALSVSRGVGDHHPGQALPFWDQACSAGSERACDYVLAMTGIYCENGSGWACNEWAIRRLEAGEPAGQALVRGCSLGFTPACAAARPEGPGAVAPAREAPRLADLPIVLRGTKPPLTERDPARLYAIACEQGWPGTCAQRPVSAGS